MIARRTSLLLLVLLGLALGSSGAVRADDDFPGLPGFQTNPWDFDPGDDGVSEGPLSSGGSGAGDPWPRRVTGVPVWLADAEVQSHSLTHPLGVVAFAWTAWDGTDGEIAMALVDTARGGAATTLRVTDDRFDDSNPRLLASPSGNVGVAWERRVGPLSMLALAPLDIENGQLGEIRTVTVLGRRVLAAVGALADSGEAHVLVARRAGRGTLEVSEASGRARGSRLVAIPVGSAATLRLRATSAGTLVLSWSEGRDLEGMLVRDREGHWGSPVYVTPGAR